MKSSLERVVEAVQARLRDRSVESAIGPSALAAHSGERRVVWVQRGGRLTPANRGPFTHPTRPNIRVRPIHQNITTVQAFLRAPDVGELELLWTDMLTAVRTVLGSSSVAQDYAMAPNDAVSGRGDMAEMVQTFEWTLLLSEMSSKPIDSTTSGTGTVTIEAFLTTDALYIPEPPA